MYKKLTKITDITRLKHKDIKTVQLQRSMWVGFPRYVKVILITCPVVSDLSKPTAAEDSNDVTVDISDFYFFARPALLNTKKNVFALQVDKYFPQNKFEI